MSSRGSGGVNFKTLLIIPSQEKVYGIKMTPSYAPLGILYVGAVLERMGVVVKVLDMDADRLGTDDIISSVKAFRPDLIGITATTPMVKGAFNISAVLKRYFDIPVVLGGIHATMNSEECAKVPSIDFVVKGEGEETICDLVKALLMKELSFSSIKGLYYKAGEDIRFAGNRALIADLDSIPFPSRHLLGSLSNYKPPDAEHMPVASIMTTRGCPGRCTYCCTKNIFEDRYRARSIENVIEEIDHLVKMFKVREIHIADDAFNVNKRRTIDLCRAIKARDYKVNFEFLNGLRADVLDEEMLDAFISVGVKNVGFGLESADKGILANVKKNIMPEVVERAVRLSKNKGLKTWVFFMIGLPGETETTIRNSIEFAKKMDPDFAKFLIFKPFPGSEIYKKIKGDGLIEDFNTDNYGVYTAPVHHLENITGADLLYWQK